MYPKPQDGYYATAPPVVPPPPGGAQYYAAPPTAQYYPPPAPPPIGMQTQKHVAWSTGLCDCSDDCGSCCLTCFCPCVTFGRIAEIVDRGSTACGTAGALYTILACFTGCECVYSCFTRKKMRAQYSLAEQPCNDCCVHLCCEMCALCQEYRELKNRGFDMIIGWQSNVEKQTPGMAATMPPMMPGYMMR